jgi:hypothetical protein
MQPGFLHWGAGYNQQGNKSKFGSPGIPNPFGEAVGKTGNGGDDLRDTPHIKQGIEWYDKIYN